MPSPRSRPVPSRDHVLPLATGIVVAMVRWWFAHERRVFHVAPDEPGQLAMARWLGGGTRWNMFDHSTWRPGFAVLISPIYWFTDDGGTVVRWALTVSAILAGLAAVVLVAVIRRVSDVNVTTAALVATLVALAPNTVQSSAFVWAEPAVSLVFLLTVWALLRFHDADESVGWGCAVLVLAVFGFTVHSRLMALVVPAGVIVVGTLVWRRRWAHAAVASTVGLAALAISVAGTRVVRRAVWEAPSTINTAGSVVSRLGDPKAVGEALSGQLWYQSVTTAGLALVGLIALAVGSRRVATPTRDTWSARVVVACTVACLGLSATFMAGRTRADQLVYGRYNDSIMWPAAAIGVLWVVDRSSAGLRRRDLGFVAGAAGFTAAAGALLHHRHADVFRDDVGVRAMVSGLLAYVVRRDAVPVGRISTIAIGLLMVAVLMIAIRHRLGPVRPAGAPRSIGLAITTVIAVLASFATVALADMRVRRGESMGVNAWASEQQVRRIDAVIPADAPIGVKMVPNAAHPAVGLERQRQRYQLFQLYLPHHEFASDHGLDDDVGPYVFAPNGDAELEAA
ncbi:MAG: phospholipid carrier-dependent glycosyltransferase, partial [Ilumatobacteraceae bacterium]